jgi:hypothetical protein
MSPSLESPYYRSSCYNFHIHSIASLPPLAILYPHDNIPKQNVSGITGSTSRAAIAPPPLNQKKQSPQPLGPGAEEATNIALELFLDERTRAVPHDCENEWQHFADEQSRRHARSDISIAILELQARFPEARAHWLQYEPPVWSFIPPPADSSPATSVPVVDPEEVRRQEMARERERIRQERAFVEALQRDPYVRSFCRRYKRCLACLLQMERRWRG